ncbi:Prepilin peptidase PppA (plasmid) [Asticcacaulis sp. MM231]|uniref:prepilin peptidase n=1 Tax=Asticcacaulis sp. MM231 TaxID=3157666 RepID=UPI0032D5A35F
MTPDFPAALAFLIVLGLSVGAVVGSFAATAAIRMSEGKDPLRGRSQCDHCHRQLSWLETLPLIGFVLSHGRCQTCHAPIDRFHMVGEFLGAFVLTICLDVQPDILGALTGFLCLCLLTAALIDLKTMRLPDVLTALVAACALAIGAMTNTWQYGLVAAVAAFIILFALKWYLERRHQRGMLGLGDVKLVAALALWLGARTPAILAFAAIMALGFVVLRRRKGAVPFGPFIAVASFVLGVLVPEGWFL